MSQFTEWNPYEHRVLGFVENRLVPIPFNLSSIDAAFPQPTAKEIKEELLREYGHGANVSIMRLRTTSNATVRRLADYVYEHVFYSYTVKQWGLTPEQLDPSVTARVPVRVSQDDRYFQDPFQAMPRMGYTSLCERMLAHPNIELLLGVDFRRVESDVKWRRMAYTGPIDEYFDGIHGTLPYRSLEFEFRTVACEQAQIAPTINYPDNRAYTRTVEMKQLTGQRHSKSTVVVEFPRPYVPGVNEPYYPIPQQENELPKAAYQKEAMRLAPHVIFAGRLADYCYYNMDQAVARALSVFERDIANG
jgi:UDP-galactopyranose mutase